MPDQPFTLDGPPPRTRADSPHAIFQAVSPDYFPALSIAVKSGRLFTEADGRDDRLVAIINEAAARLYWPGEDPVGKRLAMGSRERYGYFRVPPAPGQPEWREIAGVVAGVRTSALDQPPQPEIFFSYRQFSLYSPALVFRTEGDPLSLAAAARLEALNLNSRAVVTDVRTLEQIAAESIAQPRFRARLIALFSALALLLSGLGIYGYARPRLRAHTSVDARVRSITDQFPWPIRLPFNNFRTSQHPAPSVPALSSKRITLWPPTSKSPQTARMPSSLQVQRPPKGKRSHP